MSEVIETVFFSNIVAVIVALDVSGKSLEVEVRKHILNSEHDVLKELIVHLWCPRKNSQVRAVLWEASVDNSVVLVVSVNDLLLKPLVSLVSHKAET